MRALGTSRDLKEGKFEYSIMDMMMAETLLAYIYHGKWKLDFPHHYLHSTHTSAEHQDLLNDSSISPLFAFCQRNEA